MFCFGLYRKRCANVDDEFIELDTGEIHAETLPLRARKIEETVYHRSELVRRAGDELQMLPLFRGDCSSQSFQKNRGEIDDRGERRSQFVRDVRQEAFLQFRAFLAALL